MMARGAARGATEGPVKGTTRVLWAGMVRLTALMLMLLSGSLANMLLSGSLAMAQTASPPAAPKVVSGEVASGEPEQVRQFLHLLTDPSVQDWLQKAQSAQQAQEQPENASHKPAQQPIAGAAPANPPVTVTHGLAERIASSRAHVRAIIMSLPSLPAQIAEAGEALSVLLKGDDSRSGWLLAAIAFGLGTISLLIVRQWGAGATREWQQAHPDPAGKLKRLGLRLMIATMPALAFTVGVLAALLIFTWPPALKSIVIAFGVTIAVILLAHRILQVLLVNAVLPDQPVAVAVVEPEQTPAELATPDPLPASDPQQTDTEQQADGIAEAVQHSAQTTDGAMAADAQDDETATPAAVNVEHAGDFAKSMFWYHRILWFIGYFAIATSIVDALMVLGVPEISVVACAHLLGIGQLALSFEVIWRRPGGWGRRGTGDQSSPARRITNIFLTLLAILLWWLWSIGFYGLFWLCTFLIVLPPTIRAIDWRTKQLLRPAEGTGKSYASIGEVCLNHGASLLLIIGAVFWMSHVWHIDLSELTDQTTPLKRLVRGLLNALITLFVANFLWQFLKALIDKRIAQAGPPPSHGGDGQEAEHVGFAHGDEAVRQARIRTLLPIFRNALPLLIGSVAIMMALSGLGVEIGPLIAGAGVVGVAVGFGSQTLVKDVISGVFYLLDDAFRVGEYIQSGNYKGTVESFSLRSVKLRHQRGPIYTVPFGQLGAVQNMSRDWIMDKFVINITYDSDLEMARKLIKKIGQELAEDPVHKPNILEPLKMQGVQEFGEYGIQIRCKIMTRPGTQFTIHRLALRRIKESFDAAGIHFALPQVRVAGNGEGDAALAAASRIRDSLTREQGEV